MTIRETLKVFSWARAQHRLRIAGRPVTFGAAAQLIASETGIDPARVCAALAGGFSSRDTQARLAAWNGLKLATKHGEPVLVPGPDAGAGNEGEPDGAVPIPPEEAIRRVQTRLALQGAA